LQQLIGCGRPVGNGIRLHAAQEMPHCLGPVHEVRTQHVGGKQCVHEVERGAGRELPDQELDEGDCPLFGL
jgi:hypothetical protein